MVSFPQFLTEFDEIAWIRTSILSSIGGKNKNKCLQGNSQTPSMKSSKWWFTCWACLVEALNTLFLSSQKIKVTNRPGKLSEQRCRNQTHLILQNIVEQNLRVESVPQNFVNCREMVTLNLLLQKYYLPINYTILGTIPKYENTLSKSKKWDIDICFYEKIRKTWNKTFWGPHRLSFWTILHMLRVITNGLVSSRFELSRLKILVFR